MKINLNALRLGASSVLAILAALAIMYPGWHWIPAVMAVAGALGIHTIPSVNQSTSMVPYVSTGPLLRGYAMSEPTPETREATPDSETVREGTPGLDGMALMGLAPVTPAPAPAPVSATQTATGNPALAAQLRDMAGQLLQAADQL